MSSVQTRRAATIVPISLQEANRLLGPSHYLGPTHRAWGVFGMRAEEKPFKAVAVMVWALPTSRRLPADGSWLELSRWCLTSAAGAYAGSRMHGAFVRWLRRAHPEVTTLVSYSDPSVGHTGSLYKACNWVWAPTWHRLRPPPSGNGAWKHGVKQSVKDRWVFLVGDDSRRPELLAVRDDAIARRLAVEGQAVAALEWLEGAE